MPHSNAAQRLEIARRRDRVETLLAGGLESSYQVADALAREGTKVDPRTVQRDIAEIEAAWQERYVTQRHIRKLRKVREAEERNAELRAEWQRSKLNKERQTGKEVTLPGTSAGPSKEDAQPAEPATQTVKVETSVTTEGRLGDPSYLTEVRRNDEFIADLLGLCEPKRHAVGGDPEAPDLAVRVTLEAVAKAAAGLSEWKAGLHQHLAENPVVNPMGAAK